MGFLDKAKKFAGQHAKQVEQGIEKAGDLVDKKTGGKYKNQVDQVQDKAGDFATGKDARGNDVRKP